jgi:hypothetical protein
MRTYIVEIGCSFIRRTSVKSQKIDLNLFSSNNHEQTYEPRVANLTEFIPPDSVVQGLRSGARGNHPFSGVGVTIVHTPPIRLCFGGHTQEQLGLQRFFETAWFPGLAVCPSSGQNRQPRHYWQPESVGDVYPTCVQLFPTMHCITQYTACRVGSLPPPFVRYHGMVP